MVFSSLFSCTESTQESKAGSVSHTNVSIVDSSDSGSKYLVNDLDCEGDTCKCRGDSVSFVRFGTPDFKKKENWKRYYVDSKGHISEISIRLSKNSVPMKIRITCSIDDDITVIELIKNRRTFQRFTEPFLFTERMAIFPVEVGDLNHDNLSDIKITVSGGGDGLAAQCTRDIYLLSAAPGTFVKHSFENMHGYDLRSDFDVDGDQKFEIVHKSLVYHQGRRYYCYNLFNSDTSMTSANKKIGFPVLVQERGYYINNCVTKNVSKDDMEKYSLSQPANYDFAR